jgi:hypothetical protein
MVVESRYTLSRQLHSKRFVVAIAASAIHFDIAKTFAIGELSKGQTKELIPAGEIFDVTIALVPIDAYLKLVGREELHELRENGSALVHLLPPEQAGNQ